MIKIRINGLRFEVWRDGIMLLQTFTLKQAESFIAFQESRDQAPPKLIELRREGELRLVYSFVNDTYQVLNKNLYSLYESRDRASVEQFFDKQAGGSR